MSQWLLLQSFSIVLLLPSFFFAHVFPLSFLSSFFLFLSLSLSLSLSRTLAERGKSERKNETN